MDQAVLPTTILKIAQDYSKKLKKYYPIDRIVVFGSYAKGTAQPWSDIDVAVVSSKLGNDAHDERVELSRLSESIDLRIESHPLSLEDLADKWNPLAAEIRKTGITVG